MSETSDKVIDKIIDNATSRLRIPIVSTYLIVLLVHNWDLFYYLFFQSGEATTKIAYIKKHFPNYWSGIFEAIGIAICVLIVVSCLDLLLTYILKEVYKNKKKIVDKINNYKSFEELENALTTQINEVNLLMKNVSKLNEENENNKASVITLSKKLEDNSTITVTYENYIRFATLMQNISSIDNGNLDKVYSLFVDVIYDINSHRRPTNSKDGKFQPITYDNDKFMESRNEYDINIINYIYTFLKDGKYIIINSRSKDFMHYQIDAKMYGLLEIMKLK